MWVYCWYGNGEQYALRSVNLNKNSKKKSLTKKRVKMERIYKNG